MHSFIKKSSYLLWIFIVIIPFSVGCKRASNGVEIGVIMPLTGGLKEPGKYILEGIELAASEYNALCKDPKQRINLIIEDSKSNNKDGESALNKLIFRDKVKIVIGDLSSGIFLSAAPIAEHNKVVMISPGASNPAVREAGDYIFRDYLSDEFDGTVMANYLFSRMGGGKVALVYVNSDYGLGVVDAFEKEYSKLGGTIVFRNSFLPGTNDFRSMILKMNATNPEIIYLVGNPSENGYFVKQLKTSQIKASITGNLAFENEDFISVARGSFDSIIYSTAAFDVCDESPEVQSFVKSYQDHYHKEPNMTVALGYDVMNILIHCLKQTSFRLDSVKDALYTVKNFPGVTGNTSFDEYGDVMKDIFIKKMSGDGTVEFVEAYRFTE